MDLATITRVVRDLITAARLPCELVIVQEAARTWRVTVRDDQQGLVSFDVPKGQPAFVREAARRHLEALGS